MVIETMQKINGHQPNHQATISQAIPRIIRSPYPDVEIPEVSLPGFALEHAEERGDAPAVIDALTGRTLSGCVARNKLICYSKWKRELPMAEQHPFKWRHFQSELILLCVRRYLRYPLSYRQLEEMMQERGLCVDHTTIYRWVQHYAPELEQRSRSHMKATTDSWKVDETYIKVKKEWVYLYRAVDSQGNTLDFFFSMTRDAKAAKHFLLKTLAASHTTEPRVINVDKNAAYPKAFAELKAEGYISENCELQQVKYLNNLVEQDHRSIKRLTKPGMGFFSVETAWRTLQGFEVMNMIRKGQVQEVGKGDIKGQITLVAKLFGGVA